MRRGTLPLLLFIILLALGAGWAIFWPNNLSTPFLGISISNPFTFHQGLDLQGGISVQLAPINAKNLSPSDLADSVATAQGQIAQRVSGGLGVTEATIRQQNVNGQPGLLVELPGLNSGDQQAAIDSLTNSGLLEFWATGPNSIPVGSICDPGPNATEANNACPAAQYDQYNPGGVAPFNGSDLDPTKIFAGQDQTGRPDINFAMQGNVSANFYNFTNKNLNQFMIITLDKKVISSAVIQGAINGQGQITGTFSQQDVQNIVTLLKYGALPVSFTVASQQTVGATLGADSVQKSLIAGAIGLGIVILFMLLYYRLPGILADFALIIYAGFTLAVFKLIGVTLSLAGIAGFILSIGMAVDANVLIFERVKEELRAGRLLSSAIDVGWQRAWPSIRDSNASTMLTCAVLYFFGSNFGATLIVGFATTLFLGVAISLFTAVIVTRTFLNLLVPTGVVNHPWFFGLPKGSIALASTDFTRRTSKVGGDHAVIRGEESRV